MDKYVIGISTLPLSPGMVGGSEPFFREMFSQLTQKSADNEFILFCTLGNYRTFKKHCVKNVQIEIVDAIPIPLAHKKIEFKINRILKRIGINNCLRTKREYNLHLLHFPFTSIDIPDIECSSVITVHDLQHEYHPEFFSEEQLVNRRHDFGDAISKAGRIIAVSNYTKDTIIEIYDIPEERISVVYEGVNANIFKKAIEDHAGMERIRRLYGLDEKYVFYPANLWLHKNHKRLIKALRILRDDFKIEINLVLTGQSYDKKDQYMDMIINYNLREHVKMLGYVPREHLPYIYSNANLLVFPSLFEGFGLPVLEAMAARCPVVCSNNTSLPEVSGDAAILFNAEDPEDIAFTISKVLNDEELRNSLIDRGKENIKLFSWKETAKETLKVYHHAINSYSE